jgi:hypothetical protein
LSNIRGTCPLSLSGGDGLHDPVRQQTLNDARLDIDNLQRAACVNSVDDLRAAIGRSDRLRSSQRELDAVNKALVEDGDGLSVSDLIAEC